MTKRVKGAEDVDERTPVCEWAHETADPPVWLTAGSIMGESHSVLLSIAKPFSSSPSNLVSLNTFVSRLKQTLSWKDVIS